jgi:hypothetical protein
MYGLMVDLDVSIGQNEKQPSFTISGFALPDADYSSYSWKVRTTRFQTFTTIEEVTTTGDKPTTTPGDFTGVTWAPTYTYESTKMREGLTLMMDLGYTPTNKVPSLGWVQATLTDGL